MSESSKPDDARDAPGRQRSYGGKFICSLVMEILSKIIVTLNFMQKPDRIIYKIMIMLLDLKKLFTWLYETFKNWLGEITRITNEMSWDIFSL